MYNQNKNFETLWLQLKNGNRDAFATIYESHIQALIAYGIKLCPDQDLLKDSIQDLFIEIWKSRANLCEPSCVRFYLLKALRYKLIHAEKERHSLVKHNENLIQSQDFYPLAEDSIQTAIIDKEMNDSRANMLRKAISSLSKRQEEAIQLRFYQGLTNNQIAELMGMNYQSVSNLLHNALIRIKKKIKAPILSSSLLGAFYFFF